MLTMMEHSDSQVLLGADKSVMAPPAVDANSQPGKDMRPAEKTTDPSKAAPPRIRKKRRSALLGLFLMKSLFKSSN